MNRTNETSKMDSKSLKPIISSDKVPAQNDQRDQSITRRMARCQRNHSDNHTEEASVSNRDSTPGGLDYVSMKTSISTKNKQSKTAISAHRPPQSHAGRLRTGGDERDLCTQPLQPSWAKNKSIEICQEIAALNSHRMYMARCSQLAMWGYHWLGGLG